MLCFYTFQTKIQGKSLSKPEEVKYKQRTVVHHCVPCSLPWDDFMPSIVKLHTCETLKKLPMFARPNHIELITESAL